MLYGHGNQGLTLRMSAQRWKAIVTAINKDPYARGRVIFDILNEPDAYGLRWEVSSNPHVPSITTNYIRFMDMASKINHSALPAANTEASDSACCQIAHCWTRGRQTALGKMLSPVPSAGAC